LNLSTKKKIKKKILEQCGKGREEKLLSHPSPKTNPVKYVSTEVLIFFQTEILSMIPRAGNKIWLLKGCF
jgi:hypothetical protein